MVAACGSVPAENLMATAVRSVVKVVERSQLSLVQGGEKCFLEWDRNFRAIISCLTGRAVKLNQSARLSVAKTIFVLCIPLITHFLLEFYKSKIFTDT